MAAARKTLERGPYYPWIVAICSTLLMAVGFGANYLPVVALKPIAAEFGWPRSIPSLGFSLALMGMGTGGIVMGWWADRAGIALPVLVGAVSVASGVWMAGNISEAWQFLLAMGLFVGVLGNGAFLTPLITNVGRHFQRNRGLIVGMLISGQSLAGVVWPPLFRLGVDQVGWRQTFTLFALFCAVTLIGLALLLRHERAGLGADSRDPVPRPDGGRVLGLPPNLLLLMICAAIIGCCIPMAMPLSQLVAHATDMGFTAARGAEMLSVLLAVSFGSRFALSHLADRIGGPRALLLACVGQTATLLVLAMADSFSGLYAAAILFGLAYGGIVPCYAIVVRDLFDPREVGWRTGTVFFFGTIGMAIGGWLAGAIFDWTGGYQTAFLVGAAANLVNVALIGAVVLRQFAARAAASQV